MQAKLFTLYKGKIKVLAFHIPENDKTNGCTSSFNKITLKNLS